MISWGEAWWAWLQSLALFCFNRINIVTWMELCATNLNVMFVSPNPAEHHLFLLHHGLGFFCNTCGQDSHHQRLSLGGWWTFTCPCPTYVGYGTHAWCTGDIDHKRAFFQRFVSKKGEKVVGKFKWLRFLCVGGIFSGLKNRISLITSKNKWKSSPTNKCQPNF